MIRPLAAALPAALAAFCVLTGPVGASAVPTFSASVHGVTARELGATWHAGCPVSPSALRLVDLSYRGFDKRVHRGSIVVAASVTSTVISVFRTLYADGFPIREMRPEAAFDGKDPASMAADNTSGFNCRYAVSDGPRSWSVHAYGEAIDVNPMENPYVLNGVAEPSTGGRFLDRAEVRPGMAVSGGPLVRAFAAVHWLWGGRWSGSPDYQHFSATGG